MISFTSSDVLLNGPDILLVDEKCVIGLIAQSQVFIDDVSELDVDVVVVFHVLVFTVVGRLSFASTLRISPT